MLGRIVPGRLPTTQANLDLLNARIKKVQFDMSVLDRKVQAGTIDSRQAGYRRQQLIGEVGELKRVIANSRLSTPSYKVPSDIRSGKPAKKYISYDDSRAFMSDYTGPARVNKMPSDWQATELTELDVPNVPKQTGSGAKWPSHWPGMHSPMIMRAVMELGEYNGKQIIDPRNSNMKLNLNMTQIPYHMDIALGIKSRYTLFYEQLATDPRFTNTDRTLVNIIMGKINRQINFAEQEAKKQEFTRPDPTKSFEKAKQVKIPTNPYPGVDDTQSGNKEPPKMISPSLPKVGPALPSRPKVGPALPSRPKVGPALPSLPSRPNFGPSIPKNFGPALARRTGTSMALGAMQSHDRRRNMSPQQRVLSRTQRQSYLAAERELSMAKARAGAKVDITKELKEAPVTRPWSMQVTLPVNAIEQLHMQLDSALSSIGLAQSMFTQQAHNYIAQMVNSLDSSMQPSDRTEFVVEKIMSEMVNRSALLKDNVRVDVRQNGWPPVNITPTETTSVDGLGSAFLKTKAAMGRLLG